ncbi:MAG: hypothetical protein ETSY2_51415 [Candidatus Entotheonella gemina]|uniref:Uncharacterized protein n=1 Tax=Candidatus Entotheonella gemina TaxID=1429439 RepID=W4L7X0_9BACT|nr:MAG: hypothetical protein ETSY2_51415 [Candidatus Entotheonella gemina]
MEPTTPSTSDVTETEPATKFIVVTVVVDNPSDQLGTLEMQGNFDTDDGIQVMTKEAYQQLGPGGISLQTSDSEHPIFTVQVGKSTTWVESNPEIRFALKLVEDEQNSGLTMEKFNVSGRVMDVELKYLGK